MRVLLAVTLAFWATFSSAQDDEIRGAIGAQIEAFKADDFDQAFTYASPLIQGLFGDSDRFGLMVRNGYPMVWRPDQVRYLDLREIAGNLWQRIMITDQAGVVHLLDYHMIQVDGAWRINGVQLLPPPKASA
jgi:hypothetical protein